MAISVGRRNLEARLEEARKSFQRQFGPFKKPIVDNTLLATKQAMAFAKDHLVVGSVRRTAPFPPPNYRVDAIAPRAPREPQTGHAYANHVNASGSGTSDAPHAAANVAPSGPGLDVGSRPTRRTLANALTPPEARGRAFGVQLQRSPFIPVF